jgi:hypothetical protein
MFSVGFLYGQGQPLEDPKTAAVAFVSLIFCLTALTLGGWQWYERYSKARKESDLEAALRNMEGNKLEGAVGRESETVTRPSTSMTLPEATIGIIGGPTAGESNGTMAGESEAMAARGGTGMSQVAATEQQQ